MIPSRNRRSQWSWAAWSRRPSPAEAAIQIAERTAHQRWTGGAVLTIVGGTILVAPLASEVQQAGNLARIAHVGRMMRPGQPAHSHSIIAVLGESPVIGKTDGIVAYESAHLDGVESEKIVRSSHSCQAEPDTILEVRRILLEHVANR